MTFTTISEGDSATPAFMNARFEELQGVEAINVKTPTYGATGDGVTDDTAAIQAAIDAASTGAIIVFPANNTFLLTDEITISKKLVLYCVGVSFTQTTTAKAVFSITASNTKVYGGSFTGVSSASSDPDAYAIKFVGTSAASPIDNVAVYNSYAETWGGGGVLLDYATNFEVSGCTFKDIHDDGIIVFSSIDGRLINNTVDTVTAASNGNGITLTRDEVDSLVTDPRCRDIVINNNVVRNNPNWQGINVKGGQNITISGNSVYNCDVGIHASHAEGVGNAEIYAPKEICIVGNSVDSSVTNGTRNQGIRLLGGTDGSPGSRTDYCTGAIVGNTVRGHGDESNTNSGAIYTEVAEGITISGNTVIQAGHAGILLLQDVRGAVVVGNTITDPWSDTTNAHGVRVKSLNVEVTIAANSFVKSTKSATTVLNRGIVINTDASNSVVLGINYSEANVYLTGGSRVQGPYYDETGWIVPSSTNAARGVAGTAGRVIFNTDDGQLNIDDGTNWTLPDGTTT